jgi:hypothetical protein
MTLLYVNADSVVMGATSQAMALLLLFPSSRSGAVPTASGSLLFRTLAMKFASRCPACHSLLNQRTEASSWIAGQQPWRILIGYYCQAGGNAASGSIALLTSNQTFMHLASARDESTGGSHHLLSQLLQTRHPTS